MSIASEITRLQTAKSNIKTSIENKGVVVSSSDKLDDYPSLIDSINISTQVKTVNPQNYTREITPDVGYRGLSKVVLDGVLVDAHDSYTSNTDSSVAYTKSVPSGALKYASLDKLGSMSYKSENLIALSDVAETTTNGITYSATEGIYTLNETANANGSIYQAINLSLKAGTYILNSFNTKASTYMSIGGTNYNANIPFTLNSDFSGNAYYNIYFTSGTSFSNDNFSPMLVSGSTAPTEFQPYFTGIRDSAITSVKSYGANLLNISDVEETTTNDITWKVENGVITLNGTCSANFEITLTSNMSFNGNYYFSAFNSGYDKGTANLNNRIIFGSEYWNISSNDFGRTITMTNIYGVVKLAIISGNVYTNGVIKPMLVKGSSAPTTYYPYRGLIQTLTIPAEVQALTGYGWGVNSSCYNYIDFENKKFIQNVIKTNSTINFAYVDSYTKDEIVYSHFRISFSDNLPKNATANIVSSYNFANIGSSYDTNRVGSWIGSASSTSQAWALQATIEESIVGNTTQSIRDYFTNNPLILYYELATPVETDISQYIDNNTIEVEASGTTTFDNTYEQAVPSEITYLVEV